MSKFTLTNKAFKKHLTVDHFSIRLYTMGECNIEFVKEIEVVVNAIPRGTVLTYGDVAALAGKPSHARQVGSILGCFGFESDVPCHRVVNFEGRTAPHWPEQINLLKAEEVTFIKPGFVDMRLHRWKPGEEEQ